MPTDVLESPRAYARLRRYVARTRHDHPVIGRLLVNSGWWALADLLVAALAFIQSVILVRLLHVDGFGVWAIIESYVSTVERLISFRIGEFVIKYLTEAVAGGQRDRAAMSIYVAYATEVSTGLLAFSIAWVGAPLAAKWLLHAPQWASMLQLYSAILVATLAADVSIAVVQVQGRFKLLSILDICRAGVTVAGIGAIALLGGSLRDVLILVVCVTGVYAVATHIAAGAVLRDQMRGARWRGAVDAFAAEHRTILGFLFSTNITESASVITKDSDNLWLSFFRGPADVAYYSLAYRIASLCYLPVRAMTMPTYRELSIKIANVEFASTRDLLKKLTALACVLVAAIGLGTALASAPVIRYVYGRDMLPAYPALLILLVGIGFSQALYWNRSLLLALGEARFLLIVGVAVLLLKVVLIFVFIPPFGYLGNALVLSIIYAFGVGWSAIHARRVLRHAAGRGRLAAATVSAGRVRAQR